MNFKDLCDVLVLHCRNFLYQRSCIIKYFIDTEFIEDNATIDLISIGIVCSNGREFYAESTDADLSKASDWVKENVLPCLWSRQADKSSANKWIRDGNSGGLLSRREIRSELTRFVIGDKPKIWGWYSATDWVAFYQLFGTLMDLPKGFPRRCNDIKQTIDELGNPHIPKQAEGEHNALEDARWVRDTYLWLKQNYKHPAFKNENS